LAGKHKTTINQLVTENIVSEDILDNMFIDGWQYEWE
jgi:hypothetical protein